MVNRKIKRISHIKNFGIFRNYKDTNVKPFGKYNVIFGWNYSGKTTLSRVFQSLQDGKLHSDLANGEFKMELADGSIVDQNNLQDHRLNVRVFNSDYVKRNLKWEESPNSLTPIFVVGEPNIEVQERLRQLEKKHGELAEEKGRLNEQSSEVKGKLEKDMTNEAGRITKELFLGRNFNRTHLEKLLENPEISSWILGEEEFEKCRIMAMPGQEKTDVHYSNTVTVDESVFAKTKEVLSRTVLPSITLERLRDDATLERWVRGGLELNRSRDECGFCGQPLTGSILADLDAHFSKDYEGFMSQINAHLMYLKDTKTNLTLPARENLYLDLQSHYSDLCHALQLEEVAPATSAHDLP